MTPEQARALQVERWRQLSLEERFRVVAGMIEDGFALVVASIRAAHPEYTPEDVIISKLLQLRQGATERSTEDIQGILRVHSGQLGLDYLDAMVRQLELDHVWTSLRPEA